MTEDFLHYIWIYRLYSSKLELVTGETLQILHPGTHNTDSGPDFFNARIRIGETEWAGNIEVHVNSSDWLRHNHQYNKSYSNVILHVVFRNDISLADTNGLHISTVELDGKINDTAWKRYLQFMASRQWIPCQNLLGSVETLTIESWIDTLVAGRFERKTAMILQTLAVTGNNWIEAFYRLLASSMGFKLNNEAFALLSGNLPYQYLLKHADNLFQVEALIFGQAGLLNGNWVDDYPIKLRKEYDFLRTKFSLTPISSHLWRFMRLHPGNFPTIRLAQFAALIHRAQGLPLALIETGNFAEIRQLLDVEASQYWETHYTFDKISPKKRKHLGNESLDLLLINLVAPFIYIYGKQRQDGTLTAKAGELLMNIKGEKNAIIRKWQQLGINTVSAYHTQALIELKNNYCSSKKCLNCRIGNAILR